MSNLSAWIEAIATAAAALAAAGTLVVAIVAAKYAKGQLSAASDAVTEAAKQRQATDQQHARQLQQEELFRAEESRPYVSLFVRPLLLRGFCYLELVVANFGRTAASDIRFYWNVPPRRCFHGSIEPVPFPDQIPFLAPGQEFVTLWDDGFKRINSELSNEKIHRVQVQYRRRPEGDLFAEECVLDWAQYESMNWVQINTVHELTNEVQKLTKTLDAFTKRPIDVHTWDGAEQQAAREQNDAEQRRRHRDLAEQLIKPDSSAKSAPDDNQL